uniref:hypothetical protein n=1 Tax=Streptomyces sp. SAT1 TaxID=1849967 RepID=UPI0007F9E42D|nr:hypothetical protein [Streptomyces sp. SAT1]ANO42328.1 hypothetical protein A8713_034285 [Streptomyces sp. SAT1]
MVDINDAIAEWLTRVLREIGDPNFLAHHGQELEAQAQRIRALRDQVEDAAGKAAWEGPDAPVYTQAVGGHLDLMDHTAGLLEATGQQAQEHANKTWLIVKQVIGLVLEILEILAVGMALSWLGGFALDWMWEQILPLMEGVLSALARFRGYLAEFTEFLRAVGSGLGRTGERVGEGLGKLTESFFVDVAPAQLRAYPGFYVSLAVPKLLSGRPVDWKGNAWQLAVFFGFDTGLGLAEGVLENTAFGAGVKNFITGEKAADDAAAAAGKETAGAAKAQAKEPGPETTTAPARPSEAPGPATVTSDTSGSATGTALREEPSAVPQPRPEPGGTPEPGGPMPEPPGTIPAPAPAPRPEPAPAPAPAPEVTPPHVTREADAPVPPSPRPADVGAPKERGPQAEAPPGTRRASQDAQSGPKEESRPADVAPPPAGRPPGEGTAPPVRDTQGTTGAVPPERPQTPVAPRGTTEAPTLAKDTPVGAGRADTPTGTVRADATAPATGAERPAAGSDRGTTAEPARTGTPGQEGTRPSPAPSSESAAPDGPRLTTESRAGAPGTTPARPEAVRTESVPRPAEPPAASSGRAVDPAEVAPVRATAPTGSDTSATVKGASAPTSADSAVAARDLRTEAPGPVREQRPQTPAESGEEVSAGASNAAAPARSTGVRSQPERMPSEGAGVPREASGTADAAREASPVRTTETRPPSAAAAPGESAATSASRAEEVEAILSPRPVDAAGKTGRPPEGATPAASPRPSAETPTGKPAPEPGSVRPAEPAPASGSVRSAESAPARGSVRPAEPVPEPGSVRPGEPAPASGSVRPAEPAPARGSVRPAEPVPEPRSVRPAEPLRTEGPVGSASVKSGEEPAVRAEPSRRSESAGTGPREIGPESRPASPQPSAERPGAAKEPQADRPPTADDGAPVAPKPEASAAPEGQGARSAEDSASSASAEPKPWEKWEPYKGQKFREALYSGLKEGFNVTAGNLMTDGVVQHITGVHLTGGEWAFEFLGGALATARHGLYKGIWVGERWAYRNQREGDPAVKRWLSEAPIAWSYYSMYLTAKDAVKSGVFGDPLYTELNPAPVR